MSSNSAQDTAALGLESVSPRQMPAWWVLSSGKPTALRAGNPAWKRREWSRWLSGLTWRALLRSWDEAASDFPESTASRQASLASLSASQAGAAVPPMSDGSGRPSGASLAWFDRDTSSWRTSQGCLLTGADSVLFSGTWPASGSMRNGSVYQRQRLARITSASAFSSLPRGMMATPRAEDSQGAGSHRGAPDSILSGVRAMLPTPTSMDSRGSQSYQPGCTTLTTAGRRMLATPQASDWKSGTGYDHGDKKQTPQIRHQSGGMLNPRPVEWMMGIPARWVVPGGRIAHTHQKSGSALESLTAPSNCTHSETALYLSRQRWLLRCLLAERESHNDELRRTGLILMPWPTVHKDILTAFKGVEDKLSIDVQRFEAIVIADMIPDAEARLRHMLRAVSSFSRPCKMKDKGCSAHVWFIMTDPGGPGVKPSYVPVVLVHEYGDWILRNHFRDCPGADQASTRPRAASTAMPHAADPTPAQASLFDSSPPSSRRRQEEYPD